MVHEAEHLLYKHKALNSNIKNKQINKNEMKNTERVNAIPYT
jgi:hypothetical protein